MNRVLKNTIKILLSILYIILFVWIFGKENILIGLTSIIAVFKNIYYSTKLALKWRVIIFSTVYVYLGIAAYLSTINVIVAIVVSLITIYYLVYKQFKIISNFTSFLFIVNYLFMLTTPVYSDRLLIRLAALVTGASTTVIVKQISRVYLHPILEKNFLLETVNLIEKKIECMGSVKDTDKYDSRIKYDINEFIEKIYINKFKLVILEEFREKLDIVVRLDKINYDLDNTICSESVEKIQKELKKIKTIISKKNKHNKNYNKNNLDFSLEVEKNILSKKEYESIRFSYSLKLAIGMSISIFIWRLFNIELGIWIVLTVYSLCKMHNEVSFKAKEERFIGTILGIIFVILLYFVCEDIILRISLLLFIGYGISFVKSYLEYVTYTTVVFIGLTTININIRSLDLGRINLILIGVVISILLNKFFLPNSSRDISGKLIAIYERILAELVLEKQKIFEGQARMEYIDVLILLAILLERKISEESKGIKDDELESFIERNHYLLLEIHDICRKTEEHNKIDRSEERYNEIIKDNVYEILEGKYNINIIIK